MKNPSTVPKHLHRFPVPSNGKPCPSYSVHNMPFHNG